MKGMFVINILVSNKVMRHETCLVNPENWVIGGVWGTDN